MNILVWQVRPGRGSIGEYVDNFSVFFKVKNLVYAKFMGVIYTLEHVWNVSIRMFWLECDSSLLCQAFLSKGWCFGVWRDDKIYIYIYIYIYEYSI